MHNYILMFLLCNIPSLGGAWGGLSYMFFLFPLCKHPLLWRGLGMSVSWGGLSLGEVCL